MTTVTIGSTEYTVYSDVATADDYFNGSTRFSEWDAYTSTEKARGLVSSTRLIERQAWNGDKEDSAQELDFGRTGLVDCAGDSITAAQSLTLAVEASQILALEILNGTTVESSSTGEDLTKRLKAGSVEIENFRAERDTLTRFPLSVMELLGCFLASNTAIAGSIDSGTDGTALDIDFGVSSI